jgi:hypothetical protein
MQAVLEDGGSSFRSEGDLVGFAEGDEQGSSCFLIVREHPAVFVFSFKSLFGHWDTSC